jgi:HEAT repeat protein
VVSGINVEVEGFRSWVARGAPDELGLGHGAEWESNYPNWDQLWSAAREAIEDYGKLNGRDVDDLLFALGRDNEDEVIAEMLSTAPGALKKILSRALASPDSQVRWQIASILPVALGKEAQSALRKLAVDDDEYVRRRALAALAEMPE